MNIACEKDIVKLAAETAARVAIELLEDKSVSAQTEDTYKAVEKRLRALPVLRDKVLYDKERLLQYENDIMLSSQGKSIVRFNKSGTRLDRIEMLEALKQDLAAQIAADEYEIKLIEEAMNIIKKDKYYKAVYNKYVLQEDDEDIAEKIPCDASTVRRNRGRLVRQLAVRLYGVSAL